MEVLIGWVDDKEQEEKRASNSLNIKKYRYHRLVCSFSTRAAEE
jgi:hypothetical protein